MNEEYKEKVCEKAKLMTYGELMRETLRLGTLKGIVDQVKIDHCKIVQIVKIRMRENDKYILIVTTDDINPIFVEYEGDKVKYSKIIDQGGLSTYLPILEGDIASICGTPNGIQEYNTVFGNRVKAPIIISKWIDLKMKIDDIKEQNYLKSVDEKLQRLYMYPKELVTVE